jgi:hypothetical protein
MTQPTGYPLPPEQIPPGYGYPQPGYGYPQPPKKTGTAVRALAAIFGLALVVLAGIGVKATFFDKKDDATGVIADSPPKMEQSPQLPGAVTMPPGVDPALVANGGTDRFLSTSKYLFPDRSDQERLDLGQRACTYAATATGTPVQVIAGLASAVGLAKYEAAALAEVATANLCPQYRSKVMLDGAVAPAPAPAPAPAGADPIVPQPPFGPGITTLDYRPEAIKPYLESVMTQPGLAGFSKQTLIDMGTYACGYLSANDDTPRNLEAGVAEGLSLPLPDGTRITDAAALTMCSQFRGKVIG